jgi:hypothetical protein
MGTNIIIIHVFDSKELWVERIALIFAVGRYQQKLFELMNDWLIT